MLRFLILMFFILTTNTVFANLFDNPKDVEYIVNNIPEFGDVECSFRQERTVSGSNIVLNSSGDFKFEKENGVVFYTTYPIKSVSSYNTKENQQINNIIKSISDKSYSRLKKDFEFYFLENQEQWTLGLKPNSKSQIANYLKMITIEGTHNTNSPVISRMEIVTQKGDVTKIWWNF